MQRSYRLKKNAQFQYVYRRGKSQGSQSIVLLCQPGPRLLVGFSVGKKVGGAVMRNLIKRRMREAFRVYLPQLKPGMYVITARPAASTFTQQQLARDLGYCLSKLGRFQDSPAKIAAKNRTQPR